jgi:hypothetical protein
MTILIAKIPLQSGLREWVLDIDVFPRQACKSLFNKRSDAKKRLQTLFVIWHS